MTSPLPRLFHKVFSVLIVVVALFAMAIYLLTVPLIQDQVSQLEERSGRTILNSVYLLVEKHWLDLEDYHQVMLAAHKRQLRNVVSLASSFILNRYQPVLDGQATAEDVIPRILKALRTMRYGNDDYIFVTNLHNKILAHPDTKLQEIDYSGIKDVKGNLVVLPLVTTAKEQGEAFHSYWWNRLEHGQPSEKLTYGRLLPELGWVVATGLYLDDLNQEMEHRRQLALDTLRRQLREITIGKTGYLYIFDERPVMVLHPNANIEGHSITDYKEPMSGHPLTEMLIAVADKPEALRYKWDKPSDPGNYIYNKISWVRRFEGFGWYIASSAYEDELHESSRLLTNRILIMVGMFLVASLWIGYRIVRSVADPIKSLSQTALRIEAGDLSARSDVKRDDEIGVLATAFNRMVERLRDNIDHLDLKVRERTKALEEANENLKELDRMKSNFLSSVSHELRTPMTSIFGFAKLIGKGLEKELVPRLDLTERQTARAVEKMRGNLGIIVTEGERLTRMINEVLDLAKLDAGGVEWHFELVDMGEILHHVAETIKPLTDAKGLTLATEIAGDLPIIMADRHRLIQVVINLAGNAVKFTETGEIRLRALINAKELTIQVADTGIGLAEADRERVFLRFQQMGDTLTDKPHGTGLGLAICQEIVVRHGGRIWVESQLGRGSCFQFTLPLVNDLNTSLDHSSILSCHTVVAKPSSPNGAL